MEIQANPDRCPGFRFAGIQNGLQILEGAGAGVQSNGQPHRGSGYQAVERHVVSLYSSPYYSIGLAT